jgi:beta-glucosidase
MKIINRITIIIFLVVVQGHLFAQTAVKDVVPYLDPRQPIENRVKDLISRLTVEEKAILLNHRGPVVERFGIRSDGWNQCLHGGVVEQACYHVSGADCHGCHLEHKTD